jgi:cell division protein ZapA (FtsZ GTPase activity inhibitor)
MQKTIRVTLGGKDLTLRGDNEEKMKRSVREVNLQIQQLQQSLREQSTPTLSLLAALNVAEKYLDVDDQQKGGMAYVERELENMAQYLERAWNQPLP